MTIRDDSSGPERMFRNLGNGIGRAVSQAVTASAIIVENEAKLLIRNSPKSGRTYSKGHRASAPGEPPAQVHGEAGLMGSIKTRSLGLSAEVFTGQNYAGWLEFGTAKMGARPFMAPALRNKRKDINAKIKGAVRKATRRAKR